MPLPIETPGPKASSLIKRFQQNIDSSEGNAAPLLPRPRASFGTGAPLETKRRSFAVGSGGAPLPTKEGGVEWKGRRSEDGSASAASGTEKNILSTPVKEEKPEVPAAPPAFGTPSVDPPPRPAPVPFEPSPPLSAASLSPILASTPPPLSELTATLSEASSPATSTSPPRLRPRATVSADIPVPRTRKVTGLTAPTAASLAKIRATPGESSSSAGDGMKSSGALKRTVSKSASLSASSSLATGPRGAIVSTTVFPTSAFTPSLRASSGTPVRAKTPPSVGPRPRVRSSSITSTTSSATTMGSRRAVSSVGDRKPPPPPFGAGPGLRAKSPLPMKKARSYLAPPSPFSSSVPMPKPPSNSAGSKEAGKGKEGGAKGKSPMARVRVASTAKPIKAPKTAVPTIPPGEMAAVVGETTAAEIAEVIISPKERGANEVGSAAQDEVGHGPVSSVPPPPIVVENVGDNDEVAVATETNEETEPEHQGSAPVEEANYDTAEGVEAWGRQGAMPNTAVSAAMPSSGVPSHVPLIGGESDDESKQVVDMGTVLEEDNGVQVSIVEGKAPEVGAVEEAPELEAVEEAQEVEAVEEVPEVEAVEEAPEVVAVEEAPEVVAVQEAPEVEAVEEAPEVEVVQEAPEVKSIEEAPEVEAAEEVPEVEAVQEAPVVKAVQEAPEVEAAEEAPEVEAAEEAPEVVAAEEAPEVVAAEEAQEVEAAEEAQEVEAAEEAQEVEAVEEAPGVETVEEAPEVEAVQEAPEVKSIEEAPEVEAVEEAPEVKSIEEAPEVEASEEAPEVEAVEEAPEVEALEEAPGVEVVEEAPEVEVVEEAPEVKAAEEAPEVKAAEEAPEVEAVEEAPEVESIEEEPEVEAVMEAPAPAELAAESSITEVNRSDIDDEVAATSQPLTKEATVPDAAAEPDTTTEEPVEAAETMEPKPAGTNGLAPAAEAKEANRVAEADVTGEDEQVKAGEVDKVRKAARKRSSVAAW